MPVQDLKQDCSTCSAFFLLLFQHLIVEKQRFPAAPPLPPFNSNEVRRKSKHLFPTNNRVAQNFEKQNMNVLAETEKCNFCFVSFQNV